MNRLLVTLIILCASSLVLLAQRDSIITNFLGKGTAWVEVKLAYGFEDCLEKGETAFAKLYHYYIDRDSVIDGEHAWIVNAQMMYNQNLKSAYKFSDLCAINMNNANEIWYKSMTGGQNYLLYDFYDFCIGGTISYGNSEYGWKSFCDSIERIDTIVFKNGHKGLLANQTYIYGLGHKDYPLWWAFKTDYEDDTFDSPSILLCFFYKGEIILQDDELMEQIKKSIGINKIVSPMHSEQSEVNTPIYDLTGRRLDKVPKKRIYIQGGKLRFVQ